MKPLRYIIFGIIFVSFCILIWNFYVSSKHVTKILAQCDDFSVYLDYKSGGFDDPGYFSLMYRRGDEVQPLHSLEAWNQADAPLPLHTRMQVTQIELPKSDRSDEKPFLINIFLDPRTTHFSQSQYLALAKCLSQNAETFNQNLAHFEFPTNTGAKPLGPIMRIGGIANGGIFDLLQPLNLNGTFTGEQGRSLTINNDGTISEGNTRIADVFTHLPDFSTPASLAYYKSFKNSNGQDFVSYLQKLRASIQ